jgi:hypothetical protein
MGKPFIYLPNQSTKTAAFVFADYWGSFTEHTFKRILPDFLTDL